MIGVEQLAPRILPYGKGGLLFMLTAYFDESETQGEHPHHFMMSGYISNERGWRKFDKKWWHALVCDGFDKHGIHWTDLASGKDDFVAIGGHKNEKRRTRLQRKYIQIIKKSALQGLYASFGMSDFEVAIPAIKRIRQSKPYRLAYYHAFEVVLGNLCEFLVQHKLLGADEKIAFIFDQNKQTENKAKEIFDHIKKQRSVWFWKHLGGVAFFDSVDFPGLQAADALANELQRDLGRGERTRRWQFERLLEGDQVADFPLTRQQFEDFAKLLEQKTDEYFEQLKTHGDQDVET